MLWLRGRNKESNKIRKVIYDNLLHVRYIMNKRFKLYLLSILYGFYNDGNVRMAVTEDEVVESRKRYVEY